MKLNKLLTVLAPIALAGSITPVIVSCGNKKSFVINYGDNINCSDKKDSSVKYHSVKDIKNAIAQKVSIEPRGTISVDTINSSLKTQLEMRQNIYYDFVAALIDNGETFILKDWSLSFEGSTISVTFTRDNQPKSWGNFEYIKNSENQIYLNDGTNDICRSYTYKDCIGQ